MVHDLLVRNSATLSTNGVLSTNQGVWGINRQMVRQKQLLKRHGFCEKPKKNKGDQVVQQVGLRHVPSRRSCGTDEAS